MEDESAAPRLTAVSSLSDPQALIDRLARRRPAPAEALQRRRPADLPLSFGQERFWFLEQLDPGNPVHAVSGLVRIRGAPAPAVLQDSFSELVRRHEILRTRFVEHAGYGSQLIDPPVPFALEVVDLSSLAVSEREAEARRLGESVAAAPFDLGAGVLMRARLFRLSADEHLAVVAMHHIIADGWSMGVLVRELGAIYSAFAHGRPSPLAELAVHYADYALWQRARLAGPVLQRHIDYWREALTGAPLTLPLTTDRPRPNVQSFRGARFTFSLGADLTAALKLLAARERVTPYMVLLAAYQIVLARQSGQDDLLVGSPVAGRGRPDLEGQIGFFVNSVVLRARVAADATLAEHLQQVKATALGAYAHQELPFDKVVELLQPDRDLSRHPIFQVWITYQNTPQTAFDFEGVAIEFLAAAHVRAMFDLSLFVEEAEEGLACALEYAADLFDASTMERFSGQLRRVLEQMASDLGVRVGAVDLLDPAERTQVLEAWNATAMACPSGTLHELISVGALAWPDSVAAVCGDEALSYAELERRSNQLARRLQGLGVGPDMVVGLCVERSLEMVVGLLGILKAGGAYLPLDPEYPAERLAFMLQDAAAPVVLTQAALDERLPSHWGRTLCLDADWPSVAALPDTPVASGAGPQNLAYVIYTSGSTGRPKGVMLTHAAAVNHMSWMAACHPLGGDDAVLQKTSVSFDASVWELFAPLLEGARLVLPPGDEARDFDRLRAAVEGGGVTRVQFVPAALGAYLEGAAGGSRLRDVFCGGSVLTSGLREAVAAKLGCRLHNLYGPTEACIDATWHSCAEDEQGPSPIGRPIWNMRAYVLDAGLQPVPVGVAGELWLAGAGLARGYLGRAALTAERFVACPFGPAGERMYRTGDLARWRANGTLDYLGRLDEQVKVRGFRIELGDIEHALSAHGDVAQCAVQAQPDGGDLRLVAYVAPKLGAELDAGALRTHLGRSLPGYMLPQQYVVLEGLPRLANGKLDRKALPDADGARPAAGYTAPRTATEETLAALWADVLGRPQIGVHDNFFDLGGDSIKSIQIVARARIAGLRLTVRQIFEHQTVEALARVAVEGVAVAAEQGLVTGDVPLTPIEQVFLAGDVPEPGHYNLSLLVESRERLAAEPLCQALARLAEHHDTLRLRLTRGPDGAWRQIQVGAAEPPLEIHDLSAMAPAARGAAVTAAMTRLQQSLDLGEGPLLRVALFDFGAGAPQRLGLVAHHVAVDGVSWRILLEDLQTAYRQLADGAPAALPPKTSAFKAWAERLVDWSSSEALQLERPYWRDMLSETATELPVDRRGGAGCNATARQISVRLDAAETEALLHEAPGAYRSQINDLLLTALAQTLGGWTGEARHLVQLEGHGREDLFEDLDVSRTVGWFTSLFPVRLDLTGTAEPGSALKAIKEQLRATPQRGIGYGVLRHLARAEELASLDEPQISFNYLGQLDLGPPEATPFRLADEAAGPQRSPAGPRRFLLDVNGWIADGRLEVVWDYSETAHEAATVAGLAQAFLGHLRALIAHCCASAGGVTPSDFALAQTRQEDLDRLAVAAGGARRVADIYPLSPLQQGLLFHSLYAPGSSTYVTTLSWRLTGPLDPQALARAWRHVVERHEILRTAFLGLDLAQPLQVVLRQATLPFEHLDWSGRPAAAQEEDFLALMRAERDRDFDFSAPPMMRVCLVRTGQAEHRLIWTVHHLVMDGWSTPVLLGEVLAAYRAYAAGGAPELPVPRPYREYIAWLQRQDRGRAEAYWRERLAGFLAPTPLGVDRPGGAGGAGDRHATYRRRLDLDLPELEAFARRHKVTLSTLACGAWALVLSRYSGQADVVFGMTLSGRPVDLPDVETRVGMFVNTLPLRVALPPAVSVADWLRALHGRQSELIDQQASPLSDVQRWSELAPRTPLFETDVVMLNYPMDALAATGGGGLAIDEAGTIERPHFPLTLEFTPENGALQMAATYDTDRLESATISRLMDHLDRALKLIVNSSEGAVADLTPLNEAEHAELAASRTTASALLSASAPPSASLVRTERRTEPADAVEAILLDVWVQVLRRKDIALDDNFFELGGDSIQCIQITARAQLQGIRLTVRQMFEHQTIAEQAAVAVIGAPIDAEQGLVVGDAPLTPIQHWFLDEDPLDAHHYTQALLLECEARVSVEQLEFMLGRLLKHHDALRLRFERNAEGWRQWAAEPVAHEMVEVVDLSNLDATFRSAEITRRATQAQASLDLGSGVLVRATLFELGLEAPQRLLLAIHHLAIDVVSWRILFEDIMVLWDGLAAPEADLLPPKTTSFKSWAEHLRDYAGSPAAQAERAYWAEVVSAQTPALPVLATGGNLVGQTGVVTRRLAADDTQVLLTEVPAASRAQIQDVLLTALVVATAGLTGARTLLLDLERHGREELFDDVDISRTVGWFTSLFPVRLDLEGVTDPGEALTSVKDQLRAVPNRGLGYGVLRYLAKVPELDRPPREICFNYQGQFDLAIAEAGLLRPAVEAIGPSRSPNIPRPHLLEVVARIVEGRLDMQWIYGEQRQERRTIEALATAFEDELQALIAHCRESDGGFTLADFELLNG